MSACVTVYVAVQSTLAPGANAPGGQLATGGVPVPVNDSSVMAGSVMVTLPVLVTWNVYVTTSPAADTVRRVGRLGHRQRRGRRSPATVTDDGGDTGAVTPAGGVPVAVAVLAIEPASISACVTV